MIWVQQLLNGLFLGSIYALIALGYTMVYGVLKLINFAHGEIFMVGAFISFFVIQGLEMAPLVEFLLALLAAMAGCSLLGMTIERAAYRPLRNAPRLAALITAIGVSLFLQNLGLLLLSADPRSFPQIISDQPIAWIAAQGLTVDYRQVAILVSSVLLMVFLQFIVGHTQIGRAMRAVAFDQDAARLMGVNVDRTISMTFLLGSALAGAGGMLYGLRFIALKPDMGLIPGLKAFIAAVLGGIGSIPGAMAGGMLMGILEVLVSGLTFSPLALIQGAYWALLLGIVWIVLRRCTEPEVAPVLLVGSVGGILSWTLLARLLAWGFPPGMGRGVLLALLWLTGVVASTGLWRRQKGLPGVDSWARFGAAVVGGTVVQALLWRGAEALAQASVSLLGLSSAELLARQLSGSTFRDAVAFAILILILLVKPTGLMGKYVPEKV